MLAIGHSARDTFEMLNTAGVTMEQKPFSIGARIEHRQKLVNRAQYGAAAEHPSLGAADYVHDIMEGAAAFLYAMLPAVIFVVACVLAFASGTSWGTFGILIPIVTAIFPASSELLIIGISACCAGAVMGDHCSPISDTTIMSSAGAQCNHIEHVSTQIPYVVTVAAVCFVGFIVAGFAQNVFITWIVSLALLLGTLFVIRRVTR